MPRALNLLLVAAFVAIIATPPLASLAGTDGADPDAENRSLAAFPAAPTTWSSARAFLPGLDDWFSDHFAFRSTLVRWFGVSRYFWLGVSPTSTVATSRDGWLFYADDGGLEDFTNAYPLTEGELSEWRSAVWRARQWCEARGITYAFTIAPDKSSIYPEIFPQTARRVHTMSRTDQILSAISDTGAGIDVRPALQREKREGRIYQKTDTHWNARGAHAAYATIIEALRVRRPDIPPARPLSSFGVVTRRTPGMDLAGMIGLKRVLGEEYVMLVPRTPPQVRGQGAGRQHRRGRRVADRDGDSRFHAAPRGRFPRFVHVGGRAVSIRALQPRGVFVEERLLGVGRGGGTSGCRAAGDCQPARSVLRAFTGTDP